MKSRPLEGEREEKEGKLGSNGKGCKEDEERGKGMKEMGTESKRRKWTQTGEQERHLLPLIIIQICHVQLLFTIRICHDKMQPEALFLPFPAHKFRKTFCGKKKLCIFAWKRGTSSRS